MVDIAKNSREVIRITRAAFKGHGMINVRVFFDTGDDELKAGKQGGAFCAALLPELLDALTAEGAE